jgi:hypothetical protein
VRALHTVERCAQRPKGLYTAFHPSLLVAPRKCAQMRSATSALLRIAQMSEGVLQCGPTHTHTRTHARAGAGLPSTPDCGLRCMGSSARTYQAQRLGLYAQQALVHEVQPESKYRIPNSKHTNTQTNKQTTQHDAVQR